MLSKLDSAEISEYMAYDRLADIDNEQITVMIAQLTALTANINGGKTKVEDFIPKWKSNQPTVMDKIKAVFGGSARRN